MQAWTANWIFANNIWQAQIPSKKWNVVPDQVKLINKKHILGPAGGSKSGVQTKVPAEMLRSPTKKKKKNTIKKTYRANVTLMASKI